MKLWELLETIEWETPYNVVKYSGSERKFLFSNFLTDTVPDEFQNATVQKIVMRDNYIDIEIAL